MRRHVFALLLFLPVALACAKTGQDEAPTVPLVILYTVGSNWEEAFHWRMRIQQDGSAELWDFDDAGEPRHRIVQKGRMPMKRFAHLLEALNFLDLADHYSDGLKSSHPVDLTLSVTYAGEGTKSVGANAGGGPAELWALQEILTHLKDNAFWKTDGE